MTKNVKNLKFAIKREMDGSSNPMYAAGKGTTARAETPVAAGDTAVLNIPADQIISATFGITKYSRKVQDTINDTALGGEEAYEGVDSEESEIQMLFQSDNFMKLLTFLPNGSTTTEASIGLVDSFMIHIEDGTKNIDLVGCYPTEFSLDISMDKPIIQTLKFKHRKLVASVAVTNLAAVSTAAKNRRTNLEHFIIGTTDIAALEMISAKWTIKIDWNEAKILNDDYIYEPTIKKITYQQVADYLTPNDATYANTWEYLLSTSTMKTDLAATVKVASLVAKNFTNMVLVDAKASEYNEKGNIKYHVEIESTKATVISTHA